MERLNLEANVREGTGKSVARRLRRGGRVPAIVYGRGATPLPVAVDARALKDALHTHAGLNVLIDLGVRADGAGDSRIVMVKDLQRNVFTHEITHVDFQSISLDETREVHVPVLLLGTPKGVVEGGVLDQHLREVLVECLPTQIPEHFELDVSELTVGHAVHAGDLAIPEGVTLLTPAGEVVATVLAPRVEEEPAPAAAAAPEGAPAEGPTPEEQQPAEEEK